mgnify:CR=1 FL=1
MMEPKTRIAVSFENWQKLQAIKITRGHRTIDGAVSEVLRHYRPGRCRPGTVTPTRTRSETHTVTHNRTLPSRNGARTGADPAAFRR